MSTRIRTWKRGAAAVLLLGLGGCGGDGGPTAPGLRPPTPRVAITPALAMVGYDFSWPAEAGASSYLIEIGTAVGASDVLVREVSGTSFDTTLPAGPANPEYYVRLRSRGAGGESAPHATYYRAVDLRSVIEALYFEVGALRPSFTAPASDVVDVGPQLRASALVPQEMYGWPAGSRVTVIASTALRDVQLQAVRDTVDEFNQALRGVIRANVVTTTDPDPRPRPGTITIAPGSPQEAGCSGNAIGCAVRSIEDGVIRDARLVVTPGSTGCVSAHEVGHGLHGFGHIELVAIEGLPNATMSPGGCDLPRMTPAEVDAIAASYERGMRAGAQRRDFVQAGLIVP